VKRLSSSAPITSASRASPARTMSAAASIALSAEVQAVETVKTGPCQSSAAAAMSAKSCRSPLSRASCCACSMAPMSSDDEATNSGPCRSSPSPVCATTRRTVCCTRCAQSPGGTASV